MTRMAAKSTKMKALMQSMLKLPLNMQINNILVAVVVMVPTTS